MIDTRLKTLLTLVETKSYTKTADLLFITQPAVTHHIKSLEKENNIKLFTDNRSFKLSPSGQIVYDYAVKAMELFNLFESSLNIPNSIKNRLNFSVTGQVSKCIMDVVIEKWIQSHPNDQIIMNVNSYDTILNKFHKGEIDFAIVDNNFDNLTFDGISLIKANILLVGGAKKSLVNKSKIKLDSLKNEQVFIDPRGSGIRTAVESSLQSRNIFLSSFNNLKEISDSQIVKKMLTSNKGLAFIYDLRYRKELEASKIKKVSFMDFSLKQDFNAIYLKDSLIKNYLKKILDEMSKIIKDEFSQ